MKKILAILFITLLVLTFYTFTAMAEAPAAEVPQQGESIAVPISDATEVVTAEPAPEPTAPWTWAYLATIAGATAATLLITQFLKFPLDKAWRIPTRFLVYIIALIIMLAATAFTSGITVDNFPLCILNAFIVAMAAYGSYEITFARSDHG